jgi:murein DD-endopeptidase MepM/ murein hydrolase activator NlpD
MWPNIIKWAFNRTRHSSNAILWLVASNLVLSICVLLSLNDQNVRLPLISKPLAENQTIGTMPKQPSVFAEESTASGFVFHDLPLPGWARGFSMPIAGAVMPRKDDQLPNAVRSYRNGRHEGVDLYCPFGTPVLAAKAGLVLSVGGDYHELPKVFRDRLLSIAHKLVSTPGEVTDLLHGRRVILDHGYADGRWVITVYSHLSELEAGLRPGNAVRQGSVIGYAGNSGTSQVGTTNDSHLHFEIRVNDHFLGEGMDTKEAGKLYMAVTRGGTR